MGLGPKISKKKKYVQIDQKLMLHKFSLIFPYISRKYVEQSELLHIVLKKPYIMIWNIYTKKEKNIFRGYLRDQFLKVK